MMGGWWEQQSQDSLFQEVKSVSPCFPWGCSTWELQLPAACIHKAEDGQAQQARDILQPESESIEAAKPKTCCPLFHAQHKERLPPSKNLSWGYTGKHEDGWMS